MGGVGRSVSLSVVGRSRRYDETCISYLDSRRAARSRRAPLATRPSDAAARRDRGKVRGSGGARSRVFARAFAPRQASPRRGCRSPRRPSWTKAERARAPRVVGRIREKDEAGAVATGGAPHPANRAVPIAMHGRVIRTFDVAGRLRGASTRTWGTGIPAIAPEVWPSNAAEPPFIITRRLFSYAPGSQKDGPTFLGHARIDRSRCAPAPEDARRAPTSTPGSRDRSSRGGSDPSRVARCGARGA